MPRRQTHTHTNTPNLVHVVTHTHTHLLNSPLQADAQAPALLELGNLGHDDLPVAAHHQGPVLHQGPLHLLANQRAALN